MEIYDGSGDKKAQPTSHTVAVVSAGRIICGERDHMTLRRAGRLDWSLYYCEAGCVYFDGKQLSAGQLWVYPPGVPQCYTMYSKDTAIYHYLHFTGSCVDELLQKLCIPSCSVFEANDNLSSVFQQIRQATAGCSFEDQLQAEYQTLRLLRRLSQSKANGATSLKRVIDDMEHSFALPYDANRYAALLSLSPDRFNHLFKEAVGIPPHAYVTTLRMRNAKALLEDTALPVGKISEKCGYNNPLYFTQAFRKHTGMTPTAYRAAHKL